MERSLKSKYWGCNFVIKQSSPSKDDWTNPGVRKSASEAWDKAQSLSLKEAAAERRKHLKQLRLAKAARDMGSQYGEQIAKERIAAMRATRRSMERRING